MSCGVSATPTGKAIAKQKAAQIEIDISAGYFDHTLLKYKPRTLGKTATEISAVELFERYAQAMKRDKALTRNGYQKYTALLSHLKQCFEDVGAVDVGDHRAGDFSAYLLERMVGQTAKQYLFLLRACWDWAQGKYHVTGNPWADSAGKVKSQPSKRVKPFSETEVKAILAGFESSAVYRHYAPMVRFLFATGVRPGEAFAIRWGSVADDFSYVVIREAVSRGEHRGCTKTGKSRLIHLGSGIAQMLGDRHAQQQPKPESLVFPSPKGKPLDDHNFNRRAWKAVLESVGVEYRSPYTVRHSSASHALVRGSCPIALAEQMGHDPQVLLKIYAHPDLKAVGIEVSDTREGKDRTRLITIEKNLGVDRGLKTSSLSSAKAIQSPEPLVSDGSEADDKADDNEKVSSAKPQVSSAKPQVSSAKLPSTDDRRTILVQADDKRTIKNNNIVRPQSHTGQELQSLADDKDDELTRLSTPEIFAMDDDNEWEDIA
jgi:integrase